MAFYNQKGLNSVMYPAYHHLQLAVLNKYDRNYGYGDVIAFSSEALGCVLVKRVAAVPGDTVQIKDGTLYVNKKISMVYPEEGIFQYAGIVREEILLAEENYFVIGDNTAESKDSRYEEVGIVERNAVIGKFLKFV